MSAETTLASGAAECPSCGGTATLDNVMLHEIIECDDCAAELEIISLDPIQIEELEADEEDYGE